MLKIKDKDGKLKYKLEDEAEEPDEVVEGSGRLSGEEQKKRFNKLKERIKKLEDKTSKGKKKEAGNA